MTAQNIFQYKKPNFTKLNAFGFTESAGVYEYNVEILEGQFALCVCIEAHGEIKTSLTDTISGEPYTLHLVSDATGAFVGQVRTEYTRVLEDIAERCFEREVFQSEYARRLIEYVRNEYGRDPEYLWEKFPGNAIWRRGDNAKWFGALLSVAKSKIGIAGEGSVEILDVRIEEENILSLVDGEHYFYGYHMNKRHWITVPLNGMVPFEEICMRLKQSFLLAEGK